MGGWEKRPTSFSSSSPFLLLLPFQRLPQGVVWVNESFQAEEEMGGFLEGGWVGG